MINIGIPHIKTDNSKVKLAALIKTSDYEKEMFFEVESKYKEYLCTEVADAFVIGILNYAMALGEDISSEAPVSARLLYQIKTYFIPTMKDVRPSTYKEIKLYADESDWKTESAGAVATSASGGVDSYYSIYKHMDNVSEKYKLTHLLIANQFNIYGEEKSIRVQFEELIEDTKIIPEHYGLQFIEMYTNHYEFSFDGFVQEYSLRICSYALALQKLFSVYYVSSGVSFKEFGFCNHDSDGFDIFNLALASNDMITFYSSGGELGRTEKIHYFSNDLFIQNHLKVCNDDNRKNCGICEKCLRTMLSLEIIGKLGMYKNSFPLEEYEKRKRRFLTIVEAGYLEASEDLLECMDVYNYKVPLGCIILGKTVVRGFHNFKCLLKKWIWLKDIYFKLKIDFLLYGAERATVYRYGTKYEIREKVKR